MEHPLLDLTLGPLPAPEVAYNPIDATFWLSWSADGTRIDLKLANKAELRALTRACLEAAETEHEATHAESGPRLA